MDRIVGDDDCKFKDVAEILSKTPNAGSLWVDIAIKFDIPDFIVKQCKIEFERGMSPYALFHEVLRNWRSLKSTDATLGILILVLEECNLRDAAVHLKERFIAELSTHEVGTKKPGLEKYYTLSTDLALSIKRMKKVLIVFAQDADLTLEKIQTTTAIKCYNEDMYIHINDNSSSIHMCKPSLAHMKQIIADGSGKFIFITELSSIEIRAEIPMSGDIVEFAEDKTEWKQLTQSYKDILLSRTCMFEDKEIPLVDFCNMTTTNGNVTTTDSILDKHMCEEILIDLINDKKPHIFKTTIPKTIEYYIPRRIVPRSKVSNKIFKLKTDDTIFVFSGISISKLASMTTNGITGNSSEQCISEKISAQFIVLDSNADFESVCAKTSKVVHWLNYCNEQLHWVKSRGSLLFIQEYLQNSEQAQELGEDEFLLYLQSTDFIDKSKQPVCISDAPGMGKSVLVSYLGRKLLKSLTNKLCFYFVMSEVLDFIEPLKNITEEHKMAESISKILSQIVSKNSLSNHWFSNLMKEGRVNMELIFDGLDEAQFENLELAYSFLKLLSSHPLFKNCRLWVATRPHLLEDLEENVQVLGYNIEPFDIEDQKMCLKAYWGQNPELDKERLAQYADKCVDSLKRQMDDRARYIAGIPLQCQLLAEVYKDDSTRYCLGNSKTPVLNISSISELYRRLIKIKFQKYQERYKSCENMSEEQLIKAHVYLSLKLLFPKEYQQLDVAIKTLNIEELLNAGILESSSSLDVPRFIHRTFAEFFVAMYVEECLRENAAKKNIDFIMTTIFSTEDFKVSICNHVKFSVTSRRFKHKVICYFVNALISQTYEYKIPHFENLRRANFFQVLSNVKHILLACATDDVPNVFNYFVGNVKFDQVAVFNDNLLFVATKLSSIGIIKDIISFYKSSHSIFIREIVQSGASLLHVAVERAYFSLVDYLIKAEGFKELLEHSSTLIEGIVHFCIQSTLDNSAESIQEKVNILDYILAINSSLTNLKYKSVTPCLCDKIYIDLLSRLLKDFNFELELETDERGNTIVHKVAQYLSPQDYNTFLDLIPDNCKLFHAIDGEGQTPLQVVVDHMEPTEEILHRFKKEFADFNSKDSNNRTILMTAISQGRSYSCLKFLIDSGSDCFQVSGPYSTLLHFTAEHVNVNTAAIYILVEKGLRIDEGKHGLRSPLEYLYYEGKFDIDFIESLCKLGNGNISNSHTFLPSAVTLLCSKVVRKLLELGAHLHENADSLNILLNDLLDIGNYQFWWHENLKAKMETANVLIEYIADVQQVNINSISRILSKAKVHYILETNFLKTIFEKGIRISSETATNLIFRITQSKHDEHKSSQTLDQCLQFGGNLNYRDERGSTLLHIAAQASCVECIKYYLDKGLKLDVENLDKKVPWEYVIETDDADCVEVLWKCDHGRSCKPLNPLQLAVKLMKPKAVRKLLDLYVHCNERAEHDFKSSSLAELLENYQHGQTNQKAMLTTATILIECKANLNQKSINTLSSILCGVYVKYLLETNFLKTLFDHGVRISSQTATTLIHRIVGCSHPGNESSQLLDKCFQFGGDLNYRDQEGNTLLHIASTANCLECVKYLLERGRVSVNEQNSRKNTPLHVAITTTDLGDEVCAQILKQGANVNALNRIEQSPFHISLKRNNIKIMELILASPGFNLEVHGSVAEILCFACRNGSSNNTIIEKLCKKVSTLWQIQLEKLEFNCCGGNQPTLLHHAVAKITTCNGDQIVKYLVEFEGFLELLETDSRMHNLLHLLTRQSSKIYRISDRNRTIEYIFGKCNALLNTVDEYGKTPLLMNNIHIETIQLLIRLGSDVLATDSDGNNILHLAATYLSSENYHKLLVSLQGHPKLRELVGARNKSQSTPLHIASTHLDLQENTLKFLRT